MMQNGWTVCQIFYQNSVYTFAATGTTGSWRGSRIHTGDAKEFCVVQSGWVALVRLIGEDQITIEIFNPGQHFGIEPLYPSNLYLSADSAIHIIEIIGTDIGEAAKKEGWLLHPQLESITANLSEFQILTFADNQKEGRIG